MNENTKKQIKFPVYNSDTNEIEELSMDEDLYNQMVEAEDKAERETKEYREELRRLDHLLMGFDRD